MKRTSLATPITVERRVAEPSIRRGVPGSLYLIWHEQGADAAADRSGLEFDLKSGVRIEPRAAQLPDVTAMKSEFGQIL
jgi:hypothetical protein